MGHTDLSLCPRCARALVHPTQWHGVGPAHSQVTLRCPDCEHVRTGVFPQADVDRFQEHLQGARQALLDGLGQPDSFDLHQLTSARASS